jgi:hypothetical protein
LYVQVTNQVDPTGKKEYKKWQKQKKDCDEEHEDWQKEKKDCDEYKYKYEHYCH